MIYISNWKLRAFKQNIRVAPDNTDVLFKQLSWYVRSPLNEKQMGVNLAHMQYHPRNGHAFTMLQVGWINIAG